MGMGMGGGVGNLAQMQAAALGGVDMNAAMNAPTIQLSGLNGNEKPQMLAETTTNTESSTEVENEAEVENDKESETADEKI